MSNNSLMIPFLFLLLSQDCCWCSGSIITGFFDEPLDLSCNENNDTKQPIEKLIVILKLSNATDTTITKFVSYDGIKVCNEDHWLYHICLSQVTSYLTEDDNRAHFVIMNPPPTLNNCKTKCAYEYKYSTTDSLSPGPVRTIKLRGRIKRNVGERIYFNCSIPQNGLGPCNSLKVVLKFNNKVVKAVNITQSINEFACVNHNSNKFYKVCQEHMNLSYVNGSSVVFVLEKTPASLNNTELHCAVKFFGCLEDNDHDELGIIIFLYDQNETTATMTPTKETTTPTKEGTTSTTASSTTTSTNGTTTSTEKDLTGGEIAGIVIGCVVGLAVLATIVIIVAIRVRTYCRRQQRGNENGGDVQEMSPMQPSKNEGQQLIMPCEIGNSSQAKYIFLKVDNMELQIFDLKNNQFHCVVKNLYYNKCKAQMNETYRMGNLVRFMVKEAWKELDRKSWQCYVRYNGYNGDIPGQMRSIRLQDRNSTETETPTNVPKSDSAVTTASSLPATYLPGTTTTASSTNTSTNGTTTSTEKDGLSKKVIAIIVSFVVVVVVVVAAAAVVVKYRHRIKSCCHNVLTRVRHRCCGNQNDHEVIWL